MSYNVWEFIGVQRSENSQSDQILKEIFTDAFNAICEQLNLDISDYSSIKELISSQLQEEMGYFFTWLEDEGINSIRKTESIKLKDTEETLHFLEYRKMLLEMDIENNIIESLLTSIAETITSIDEFMDSYLEQAATTSIRDEYLLVSEQQTLVSSYQYGNFKNFVWNNSTNPADTQQDFWYYRG